MSDKSRQEIATLQQEVELLKKALTRENKARSLLESKIASFEQSQFDINKELLSSYESARIREVQLQFLAFLSKANTDDKSLNEIIVYFADNISQLFNGVHCLLGNQISSGKNQWQIKAPNDSWKLIQLPNELISQIHTTSQVNQWQRFKTEQFIFLNEQYPDQVVLLIEFTIKQKHKVHILLVLEHYCYSDDFKDTLQIAASQFASMLEKQVTDAELSFNYHKLKSTVKALKKTQRQLLQSEKMASLGTLAAGVAHEINNPLSYLASNLETLQDYAQALNTQLEALTKTSQTNLPSNVVFIQQDLPKLMAACTEATTRISEIVNSLRTFSRKEDDVVTKVNLKQVLSAALEIVGNSLKYNHIIEENYHKDDLTVLGNFGQLQQVFVNLFVNASQAMPEGGTLSIATSSDNDALVVKVSDTGQGMSNETKKHIFEPFYTTKPENQGTGLGLSVSYAIISNHRAYIDVDSVEGEGTQFTLRFPLD